MTGKKVEMQTQSETNFEVRSGIWSELNWKCPDGVEFCSTEAKEGGIGLVSTRSFKKGDVLYTSFQLFLPQPEAMALPPHPVYLYVRDQKGVSSLQSQVADAHIHGHPYTYLQQEMYSLYGFDGFMNHSCLPSTSSQTLRRQGNKLFYNCVALRDLAAGTQITADYNLFTYDVKSCPMSVQSCACGSPNCHGRIYGFRYLPWKEQLELLPEVDLRIAEKWCEEHREIVHQVNAPWLDIVQQIPEIPIIAGRVEGFNDSQGWCNNTVASRAIQSGETLFENEPLRIPDHHIVVFPWRNALHIAPDSWFQNRINGTKDWYGLDSLRSNWCHHQNSSSRYW